MRSSTLMGVPRRVSFWSSYRRRLTSLLGGTGPSEVRAEFECVLELLEGTGPRRPVRSHSVDQFQGVRAVMIVFGMSARPRHHTRSSKGIYQPSANFCILAPIEYFLYFQPEQLTR